MVEERIQAVNCVACNHTKHLGCDDNYKLMAWKRRFVHLYEVFTTLRDTSLFTMYTQ